MPIPGKTEENRDNFNCNIPPFRECIFAKHQYKRYHHSELRLKNTSASYNEFNNDATIFEETFSAVTGEEEGSGGLSPYIWNATTSQPSQYAKSISTIPALLHLGTGQ